MSTNNWIQSLKTFQGARDPKQKEQAYQKLVHTSKQNLKSVTSGISPLRFKLFLARVKNEKAQIPGLKSRLKMHENQLVEAKKIHKLITTKNISGLQGFMQTNKVDNIVSNAKKTEAVAETKSWRSFGKAVKNHKGKAVGVGMSALLAGTILGGALTKKD